MVQMLIWSIILKMLLATKERKDAFSIVSTSESQHMSFYIGDKVKSVNGKLLMKQLLKH